MTDNIILRILAEAGPAGLSVMKIARHVYNEQNTFFNDVSFEDIHREVQQFVLRHSGRNDSLLERMEKRGMYRLNQNSPETIQLMLQFGGDEEEQTEKTVEDQSLSLFDWW